MVLNLFSFLSIEHTFGRRRWTLMSIIHTRNVVFIHRAWCRVATALSWAPTAVARAWRNHSTPAATYGWAVMRIRAAALLTHVSGMSRMSTLTVAISIVTIAITHVVIPTVSTVVIMTPVIIPIIAVIFVAVTILSIPIASIVLDIPNPTITIVATSTSTAYVGPLRTMGGSIVV